MLVHQNLEPHNLTITLFDGESDAFLEAIDAIMDPAENPPTEDGYRLLQQLWLKIHRIRSH